jgi:hypothetical protein
MRKTIEASMVVIDKTARTLSLVEDGQTIATFPALLGKNSGPKEREGDMRTPEGRYFVLQLLPDETTAGTGYYKGLHISYPEVKDAEKGFAEGRIDQQVYEQILWDYQQGKMPPQESALGGCVAIHAGLAPDEKFERGTKGCVVLRNEDMDHLYAFSYPGMPILILP